MIPKLYTFGQYLYGFAVRIAALSNTKAMLWVQGRRNAFDYLENNLCNDDDVIWIHAPSLGEFEQARPLIHQIKSQLPQFKLVLTFYSPSGYELRKDYPGIDCISYLPIDTPSNASKFIELLNPKHTFFVKYDFWPHYLNELQKRGHAHYFISSIFRPNQYFFKFYGAWMLDLLSKVNHFFVQNQESKNILNRYGVDRVSTVGDTRFDQVIYASKFAIELPILKAFKGDSLLFIAGSSWPKEEIILKDYIKNFGSAFKYVIAPHEINKAHILQYKSKIPGKVILYSECSLEEVHQADILIIDNIGMLSKIYQYADFAYIGGGFGKGIHNILEAAVFGMPIFIGPNNSNFKEAKDLKKLKVAIEIYSAKEMIIETDIITSNYNILNEMKLKSLGYIKQNGGATSRILDHIFKNNEH